MGTVLLLAGLSLSAETPTEPQEMGSPGQDLTPLEAGLALLKEEDWPEAEKAFALAIERKAPLAVYSHYFLGVSQRQQGLLRQAQDSFTQALTLQPNRQLRREIRHELAQVAIARGHWNESFRHLSFVERGWRRNEKYPEVLWQLVGVELKRNRKWMACRWARRLYSDYPSHPLLHDWGVDLQAARYEGQKLGCVATENDQRRRFRRLQWAGEPDRARGEIEVLRERARGAGVYEADAFLANFLTQEGFVDEAVEVLLRHYDSQKSNLDYLLLLARAAARAGEFQAAVGIYYSAHQLSPQRREGREALFHSAFLSYQFQDYDGASRRFAEFIERYPNSGLTRDAHWHRAWIRYLREDYEGAVAGFEQILQWRARSRRAWARHPADKIRYWMAMSHLRMENYVEAYKLFNRLVDQDPHGFYALAARERLGGIPQDKIPVPETEAQKRGLASGPAQVLGDKADEALSEAELEALESEETLSSEVELDEEEDLPVLGSEEDLAEEEEQLMVTGFESPQLQKRFEQAKALIYLGQLDWARWELFEIESRTRNRKYLQMLISQYEAIQAFNRSARLSQNHFGQLRNRQPMEKNRELWQQSFPRAYEQWVASYSEQLMVPPEFVWSIMKAESYFQPDVVSPVGARGLMQIMPNTGRQVARLMGEEGFDPQELFDPQTNIHLGVRYLSRLSRMFQGSLPLMAAAYNAGPHRVEGWLSAFGSLEMDEFIEHIPFLETRNYVKRVLGHYGVYTQLSGPEERRIGRLEWLAQPLGLPRPERVPARESWESFN